MHPSYIQPCGKCCMLVVLLVMAYYGTYYRPAHIEKPEQAPFSCGARMVQTGTTNCEPVKHPVDSRLPDTECPAEFIPTHDGKCLSTTGDGKGRYWTQYDPAGITRQNPPGF